jgi:hypothetical protein
MAVLMKSLLASHVDYGDFVGVIPNKPTFTPSDLDGIAERNGKFFVMEWKRPKEKVSTGQRIMLQALAGKPDFIVVIVIGDTDNGMKVQEFFLVQPQGSCIKIGTSKQEFIAYYKQWYEWADGIQK